MKIIWSKNKLIFIASRYILGTEITRYLFVGAYCHSEDVVSAYCHSGDVCIWLKQCIIVH